jgi:uncharacterized linocin/CFP29 family protein
MMADDACPLPWTPQQWAALRGVVREAARKSRVASTFLPLVGPVSSHDSTVASNWIDRLPTDRSAPGVSKERLEIRAGKTLQLVTVSCNLYLRGSEVADPDLDAVKSLLRRAGEVIGRVEDAVVFRGFRSDLDSDLRKPGDAIVKPEIYTISGGGDFIGLRESPEKHLNRIKRDLARAREHEEREPKPQATEQARGKPKDAEPEQKGGKQQEWVPESEQMFVPVSDPRGGAKGRKGVGPQEDGTVGEGSPAPIVDAVIRAVEKLESHGHFGPFATVLGHELFRLATTPTNPSLVLPTDRITPFLEGGPLLRSGSLDNDEGLVVALGGSPVELVLGTDLDIDYLQRTLEPRYVIRVYERFVLRIKELDAVCGIKLVG